jgi:hypothetical protein
MYFKEKQTRLVEDLKKNKSHRKRTEKEERRKLYDSVKNNGTIVIFN